MNRLLLFASDCGKVECLLNSFEKYFNVQVIEANYKQVVNEVLSKDTQCVFVTENSLKSQIIFNKFDKIRAAICYNQYFVQMCREHNDANVIIIPLDNIAQNVAIHFAQGLSQAEFDTKTTPNHQRRVNKLNLIQ
ncbi:unnamed protein product [Paramecium octaurelia]|uniref:Uncharacterized protein n=1 Tax=Paramecium octaurelia TaxID=43137 RepID=A0A8S1YDT3_PAROT|nr:unnamed protein product [Paramecium octaurelia]